ncbi:hypothetical protein ACFXJ8_13380 [Nonomuraea sp. NPDC059194]|uniref:hypothetical protein n=1 Tax=Nonomuraea sp. NPDC059194 TaxID=3346764 RepID=UPI00368D7D36
MGSIHTPVPAVVIIDTRNLVGQAKSVLGVARNPTVPGVCSALALYGFDVRKVIAATGTRSQGNVAPGSPLESMLAANCDYAAQIRVAGGVVVEGYLRDRYGKAEEKQVDVLCARAIAEEAYAVRHGSSQARAVVLLSMDSDLTPMFEFAQSLGVPVFAAASSAVHNRDLAHWLLLGQAALATMTGAVGLTGHGMRDRVARAAFERWSQPLMWKVKGRAKRNNRDVVRLRHSSGMQGTAIVEEFGGRWPAVGSTHSLYPAGVDLGERSNEFPLVMLTRAAATGRHPDLVRAMVVERVGPTKALVRLDIGGCAKIEIPVDNTGIGRRILVHVDGPQVRLVGGLEPGEPTSGRSAVLAPVIAEVTGGMPKTGATKAVLADGSPVSLRLPLRQPASVGTRYAAVSAGMLRGGFPLYQAVSSPLPRDGL